MFTRCLVCTCLPLHLVFTCQGSGIYLFSKCLVCTCLPLLLVHTCPGSGIQYVLYQNEDNPLQTYNNHLVNCAGSPESRLPTSTDLPCIKFVLNTHREKFPEHNFTTVFFYANGAANTMTMSANGELSTSRLSQAQRNQVFPGAKAAMCIPACQQLVRLGGYDLTSLKADT